MVEALTITRPDPSENTDAARTAPPTRHVLHVLPGFGVGGIQVRLARVINALGPRFRHTIVSLSGDLGCRERLDTALDVVVKDARPSGGLLTRLGANAQHIRAAAADVLATYN